MTYRLDMPFAHGGPLTQALFRTRPEDFQVIEDLGFVPEGEGEHQYLRITKRGANTQWVADAIARFAGVKPQDVGFCGLKDRHGIATQWFSVYLPKREPPDWQLLAANSGGDLEVEQVTAGRRKLRRGQHAGNHFVIVLRSASSFPLVALEERLARIASQGVPNYFGEQRFGREGNNLLAAARWLEEGVPLGRLGSKGMIISAARSHLFNLVLAARVSRGDWNQLIGGDIAQAPSGPLWGRGRPLVSEDTLAVEEGALAHLALWRRGLEHCGLLQERRPLVLLPVDMKWALSSEAVTLQFFLPPGQFATCMLREAFELLNQSSG
jgi:tRNA pseudouridine13 synthase